MPQFAPSAVKTAVIPIKVSPAGLSCEAELFLGPNDTTKVATSGKKPFTSTGASQNVSLPITMPSSPGSYRGYIDVFAAGTRFLAYEATEDVVVSVPAPPPPPGITLGWKDWGKGQPYPPWLWVVDADFEYPRAMYFFRITTVYASQTSAASPEVVASYGLDPLTVKVGDVGKDKMNPDGLRGSRIRITGIYSYDNITGKPNWWWAEYSWFYLGITDNEAAYNLFLAQTILNTPREYASMGFNNGDHNPMLRQLEEIGAADVTDVWRAQVGPDDHWYIRMIVKDAHLLYLGMTANSSWSAVKSYDAKVV